MKSVAEKLGAALFRSILIDPFAASSRTSHILLI